MAEEQAALQDFANSFCVCRNKPENDAHWDSEAEEWIGKASMSARHRFLTTKDLRWTYFNALTLGMTDEGDADVASLSEAIQFVEDLKAAAVTYVTNMQGWSDKIGLFFHVFGHNSVNSLHLHIVDMNSVGPTFHKLNYKNCSIGAVLKVLREELTAAEAAQQPKEPRILQPKTAAVEETEQPSLDAIQELNVGGEFVAVSLATLHRSPPNSFLKNMVENLASPTLVRDSRGRIFLDLPPESFKQIINHLRMQELNQTDLHLRCADEDTRLLAESLGIPTHRPPTAHSLNLYVFGAALAVGLCLLLKRT
ncbi:KCTD14 [Symbiodinium pilosum]|uniref:KCTD14 protein n=1 Tax=Symbiodinium pilosum TaxID=2952 RepID=A0A812X728_SYMPI|nr:KCTD14 [Symbiodinium pilosum]